MEENSAKRTGNHALLTGDAFFIVNIIDTILRRDGSGRAVLHAFGDLALSADDRHPYDGMRIDHHHSNGALLRVIHSKAIDRTDQFANLASRTAFGNDSQLPRHLLLLALSLLSIDVETRDDHIAFNNFLNTFSAVSISSLVTSR
jgi:hypothetical protein